MSIKDRIQQERLEKRQRTYARLAILLALLAALCITGALVLQYRASELRQGSRRVEAQPDPQQQQRLAQEQAEKQRLGQEVQTLQSENEDLRGQVEALSGERDQARQDLQTARRDLQAAREEARQLEQEASWRRLSDTQKTSITQILESRAGDVLVASVRGDPEARQFARQLHDAIQAAGWLVQLNSTFDPPAENVRGLAVLVRDRQNPPQHAGFLQSALEQNGFKAPGGLAADAQAEVTLLVAPRP